jgi:DNA primase
LPAPGLAARKPREPAREIIIIAVLIGHPALLERHGEEIAGVEFAAASLSAFRDRLLAMPVEAYGAADDLAAALGERGAGPERERILAAAGRMPNWWCLRAEGELSAAEHVLRQSLALQRKFGALHKDLRSAERALAAEPTEQNFARLLDIKASLADLANEEAAIEGFGEFSGRDAAAI